MATWTASGGSAASRPASSSARAERAAVGDDLGHDAERGRLGRGQPLAQQDSSLARAPPTRRTSRCVAPELGRMPIATSGSPNDGAGLGHAEVARERELQAAAQAPAGDRRDRRLGQGGHALVDVAGGAVVGEDRRRVHVAQLGDVGAGRERTLAAGEHDAARVADLGPLERVVERALERARQRVELAPRGAA